MFTKRGGFKQHSIKCEPTYYTNGRNAFLIMRKCQDIKDKGRRQNELEGRMEFQQNSKNKRCKRMM